MPFVSRFAVYGSKGWREIREDTCRKSDRMDVLASDVSTGRTVIEDVPAAEAVLANLESLSRAVRGEIIYPIPAADRVANTRLRETVGRAVAAGQTVHIDKHN